MTISRRTRFEVLRRDGHTCRYCGAQAPDVKLTVDHVIPEALGGGDDPSNLVTACQPCNAGKSSIAPDQAIVEDVDATALLFSRALERVIEQRALAESKFWDEFLPWSDHWARFVRAKLPLSAHETFRRFRAVGLSLEELYLASEITADRGITSADGSWRYFCKVCWNKVGEIQEATFRLIEDGEV